METKCSHRLKFLLHRNRHRIRVIIIIRHGSMVLYEITPFCPLLGSTVVGYYPLLRPNIYCHLQPRTGIWSPRGHLIRRHHRVLDILHHLHQEASQSHQWINLEFLVLAHLLSLLLHLLVCCPHHQHMGCFTLSSPRWRDY